MKRFIGAFFLIVFSMSHVQSEESLHAAWFDALRTSDRQAFERILADDFRIILKDTQIIQTKKEFIESLDSQEEELDIRYSADKRGENEIIAEVCYQFPSKSFINTETFTMESGKIVLQVQEKLQDGC